ncbi:uncharacterized protein LOC114467381 [Gouania willdenowi]|uniref:uncharacterized protein LOC114467381 n=1 Tax=Gouania willdenowi TaxID=441366 RepID=UPI001055CDDF|nr:uncharacterized protein LOC114467381 [Gouania willdenowi]XP_028309427.1 uncharacterized protein LOC114467381 [Gouania willdenowi]
MGHQNKQVDVESLQGGGQRRGRCLDACLVVSVLLLFVAVAAVAVGGFMAVMELRSQLEASRLKLEPVGSKLNQVADNPTFKMQNFAYLEATSGQLTSNSTMRLDLIKHGDGTSVGSNFIFDSEQHSLTPKQEGSFFVYINLHLTCIFNCSAGLLRVQVGDKLTCEVELPSHSRTVTKKCWTVTWMERKKLITQIMVPNGGLPYWKLELTDTGLGVFLVD